MAFWPLWVVTLAVGLGLSAEIRAAYGLSSAPAADHVALTVGLMAATGLAFAATLGRTGGGR